MEKLFYWGRYYTNKDLYDKFYDDLENFNIEFAEALRRQKKLGIIKMIWIGPLTKEEMMEDFCEFRHNFKESK
jgi:hypothetical protein